jgi:membrane fusion protein (multidrug efflux system)
MKYKQILQILGTGVFLSLLLGCQDKGMQAPPLTEVTFTMPEKSDVDIIREFVGQTYGFKDIEIQARVDGFLEGIHFEEGSYVNKGQLLYTIDPLPYQAQVSQAKSKLIEARSRKVQAESDLDRYEPLAEKNAISQKDYDAAKANYEVAKASVEAAEAIVEEMEIQLSYTRIKSPITGFIGKTLAKEGDYVGRGINAIILNTVSQMDPILVEFSISERVYLALTRYTRARRAMSTEREAEPRTDLELVLSDNSVHTHPGKLDFVDRQVDPTTGAILLQASFPNPEKILRPGQFARIRTNIDTQEDALLIPERALMELQGLFRVYVLDDENKVSVSEVVPGERVKDMVLIREGISASDRVVVDGIQKVREGMTVSPVELQNEEEN